MNHNAGLAKKIDSFFSDAVLNRFSEDERIRARIIISVLSCSAIGIGLAAFFMLCLSLLMIRDWWIGVLFAYLVAIGMGTAAFLFGRNGKIFIAANVFSCLMFISIAAAFLVTGGIHSPVAFLLLAVPVSIFMVAGRNYGLIWSLLTLLFYLLVFMTSQMGVELIQIMRDENREVVTTSLWYLAGVIIIGFLALYERIVDSLTSAIHAEKSSYHDEAIYDPLTGFLNREAFQEKFEDALHGVSLSGGRLALLRVDIKNLKQIIAQFGYEVGDELVKKVSAICLKAVGYQGLSGRFGSGELCILIPQVQDRGQIISLISRLKKECGNYIETADGIKIPTRLSIGGVFAPDFSISSRSLLRGVQDALVECESLQENFVLR